MNDTYKHLDPDRRTTPNPDRREYPRSTQREAIRLYIEDDLTATEVEARLGVPPSTVCRWANIEGHYKTNRALDRRQTRRLIAQRREGATYRQLADRYGVSASTARNYIKAFAEQVTYGNTPLYQKRTPDHPKAELS